MNALRKNGKPRSRIARHAATLFALLCVMPLLGGCRLGASGTTAASGWDLRARNAESAGVTALAKEPPWRAAPHFLAAAEAMHPKENPSGSWTLAYHGYLRAAELFRQARIARGAGPEEYWTAMDDAAEAFVAAAESIRPDRNPGGSWWEAFHAYWNASECAEGAYAERADALAQAHLCWARAAWSPNLRPPLSPRDVAQAYLDAAIAAEKNEESITASRCFWNAVCFAWMGGGSARGWPLIVPRLIMMAPTSQAHPAAPSASARKGALGFRVQHVAAPSRPSSASHRSVDPVRLGSASSGNPRLTV